MLLTSDTYKRLWHGRHTVESRVNIAGHYLYDEDLESPVEVTQALYGDDFGIGNCVGSQIKLRIYQPNFQIPKMAAIKFSIRLTDGVDTSEWVPQGEFLIDTRKTDKTYQGYNVMEITGYDRMLMTEGDCPRTIQFPAKDIDIVDMIANSVGIDLDADTIALITSGYLIGNVEYYSGREILGYIAGMYGGNFVITKENRLRFVPIQSAPEETFYLVDENGRRITIGGDRVVIR